MTPTDVIDQIDKKVIALLAEWNKHGERINTANHAQEEMVNLLNELSVLTDNCAIILSDSNEKMNPENIAFLRDNAPKLTSKKEQLQKLRDTQLQNQLNTLPELNPILQKLKAVDSDIRGIQLSNLTPIERKSLDITLSTYNNLLASFDRFSSLQSELEKRIDECNENVETIIGILPPGFATSASSVKDKEYVSVAATSVKGTMYGKNHSTDQANKKAKDKNRVNPKKRGSCSIL